MNTVDLRSDTVTRPTPAMREAMARAEVGDDVYREDPTVRRLEERVAELLGQEAALFVPSGTMANQLALRAQTEPGDEILAEAQAHVLLFERGAHAALAGVTVQAIPTAAGVFGPEELARRLHQAPPRIPPDLFPPQRLLCLENTHNSGGGTVWPLETFKAVVGLARESGLRVHLDGARIWNASVAAGVPERSWTGLCDSVAVCFSKGLGAPVGSAVAGSRELVERARRFRGMYGGAMRQAGVLAAAALYALEHHRERLAEDHRLARKLARGIAELPALAVEPERVQTNIVYFRTLRMPAEQFAARAGEEGVKVLPVGHDTIRCLTHLEVEEADIDRALAVFAKIAGG